LDGLKALVFRLLPAEIVETIAYVPMTTDGPWPDLDKAVFETAVGIPNKRTFWEPGGFVNVPPSTDREARSKWVDAVANISHRYLFLDPDIGFYSRHTGKSQKMLLVKELGMMLRTCESLIVYRHQYWPNPKLEDVPGHACHYVWHGLNILKNEGFAAFAYQSQAASFFFVAKKESGIKPLEMGLRDSLSGISPEVIGRRIVKTF
jgi:hypothetical protein